MKMFRCSLLVLIFFLHLLAVRGQSDQIPAHDSTEIFSVVLSENRKINIWVPPDYTTRMDSYPVLYMLDGGINEDFPHIANTVSQLIMENKIPKLILVGIPNTTRRLDLTGETEIASDRKIAPKVGGSAAFRKFINDELFPMISKKYRVKAERGIIGESLAGLFITETFLTAPEMFDFYIAMDPSLWWNDHYLVKNAQLFLEKLPDSPKRFWFAGSPAKDIYRYTDRLAGILNKSHLPALQWFYSREKNEQHSTIFKATKEKALIWAFQSTRSAH